MHTVSKESTQYLLTIYAVHTLSTLSTHYLNKNYSVSTQYLYLHTVSTLDITLVSSEAGQQ